MSRIRVLPDRVANQIAAGEVIERPAAVVKELVENALDAGATRVEVEFSHGGRSLMRVEDNGCGMSRDDALLALERHATSKIQEADDLNRLITFGFRGEALPSIASVSRFLLQTREAGAELGTEVLVNGGKYVHVRECGRPVGTRIEVSQLFNSVPARRKFLKTDTTEAAHIIHNVRLYALAFPQVSFTLIEDGRIIFKSPQCATLAERVSGIFGKQLIDGLVPLQAEEQGMRVSGLIGMPGHGRATRHEMITFINQRPVDSRTLNYALIESYHESLPKGRYPVAFVFFDIPPVEVDVNVHPAKREVRFRSEPNVRSFVIRTVLSRLRELRPSAPPETMPLTDVASDRPACELVSNAPAPGNRPAAEFTAPAPPSVSPPRIIPPAAAAVAPSRWSTPVVELRALPSRESSDSGPAVSSPGNGDIAKAWRYLGQAHRHFLLFETPAGLMLLDRRSAQERIWYERFQTQFAAGGVPSQRLLLPVPLEFDSISTALLTDARAFLAEHGFEIAEFGRNFFRIEAVPDWMLPSAAEECLRDLLALLREGRLHLNEVNVARDELARFASLRASRGPESVSEPEARALVAELFRCRTPLTSPSGRPTLSELSQGELARRFGRSSG